VCSTFASSVFSPAKFRFRSTTFLGSTTGISLFIVEFAPGPIGACLAVINVMPLLTRHISFISSLCTIVRIVLEAHISALTNVYLYLLFHRDRDRNTPADSHDYTFFASVMASLPVTTVRDRLAISLETPMPPPDIWFAGHLWAAWTWNSCCVLFTCSHSGPYIKSDLRSSCPAELFMLAADGGMSPNYPCCY